MSKLRKRNIRESKKRKTSRKNTKKRTEKTEKSLRRIETTIINPRRHKGDTGTRYDKYRDPDEREETIDYYILSLQPEISIKNKFGKCIKHRRKILGISINKLSKKSYLNKNTIIKIEKGEIYPTLKTIGNLAEALKIKVSILMTLNLGNLWENGYNLDYNDILKKFGNQVKKFRKEKGLTQTAFTKKKFAKEIRDKSYISKIENGKANISLETIGRIQRTLNIHLNKLMDF